MDLNYGVSDTFAAFVYDPASGNIMCCTTVMRILNWQFVIFSGQNISGKQVLYMWGLFS